MKGIKKTAWDWCSKYIRLRDAIEYHKSIGDPDIRFCRCCTCGKIMPWRGTTEDQDCDAGHYIGRGMGGSSGVYFDERNIHAQCKAENKFGLYTPGAYDAFMLGKYGQGVIEELQIFHKVGSYKGKLPGFSVMYREMYKSLCAQHGVKP